MKVTRWYVYAVLSPHPAIDSDLLIRVIREQFDESATRLEFVPLGEDSWCYRLGSLWVSVRRDREGHAPTAYLAAYQLREAGNDFVLAPLAGRDGAVVRAVQGLPVVVFPFVRTTSLATAPASRQELDEVVAMIGKVHAAEVAVDVPVEDFRFPFGEEFTSCVGLAARGDPESGPYSARLHRLVTANLAELRAAEAEAGDVIAACRATAYQRALTHGEPSAANILRRDDQLLLADWSGTMWAPAERDWFHVHRTLGVAVPRDSVFLRFYQLRWFLGQVSEYVSHFVDRHSGDDDDHAMWQRLLRFVREPTS